MTEPFLSGQMKVCAGRASGGMVGGQRRCKGDPAAPLSNVQKVHFIYSLVQYLIKRLAGVQGGMHLHFFNSPILNNNMVLCNDGITVA